MPRPLIIFLSLTMFAFFASLCGVCVYALSLPGANQAAGFAHMGFLAMVLGTGALMSLFPVILRD